MTSTESLLPSVPLKTIFGDLHENNQMILYTLCYKLESPMPLTDPCDAEAQRLLNIPYRIIW